MNNAELYKLRDHIVGQITDKNISTRMCICIEELIKANASLKEAFSEYGDEGRESMLEASLPLMKYLADKHNPHVTVNVTSTSCEMLVSCMSNRNVLHFVD